MSGRLETFLVLDPGGTTGWSTWLLPADGPLEPIDHGMIPGGLHGFIRWWRDIHDSDPGFDFVVSESFILDGRTAKPDITPLHIEGALAVFCSELGLPLYYQRNVYKAHAPDELLRRLGYYWPGAGHDRDSARHAIAYALTQRHMPTLMAIHPPPAR
ncbi:hypothetical protein [Leifsonia aquatica]|uniref:hypothetical protein n=1 Tax=Leifsonia aquatica TaxID=144185 RepID=UPI0013B39B39|nr:hypothetical protein [Leifsonia aquatica]